MTIAPREMQATVKLVDMPKETEAFAITVAQEALEKYSTEQEFASHCKKEFDRKFTGTWHCFAGRNFSSYVTHETHNYIYFYLGQVAFMIFKSG